MSDTIVTKRCSYCNTIKTLSEFYRDRRYRFGVSHRCKICSYLVNKQYYQTEEGKENQKCYRISHPNHTKARHAVGYAVKSGRLPRPDTFQCHYCPSPAMQYHHWHGYEPEHWFDIVPVCQPCDIKGHKFLNLSKNIL